MSIAEGTVIVAKHYASPVEAVFAAWSRAEAQLAWSDPGEGWAMRFDQFRFAVGEADICRFGPVGGPEYVNENRYLAIERQRRIVYATSLSSQGALTFAGTVAVELDGHQEGTRLTLFEQGLYFDGRDDLAGHQSGWDSMLTALGRYLCGKP